MIESRFPFLIAHFVSENTWPFFIRLPENYLYHEPLIGFLVAAPATWFALTTICGLPTLVRQRQNWEERQILWTMLWLLGGLIFLIAPILTYVFSTMRFQLDFIPVQVVLSVSGMWLMSRLRLGTRFSRSVLWIAFGTSVIITALAGFLIGMSEPSGRFEAINPSLFQTLADSFNQWLGK